jgi:hypothetical protein
MEGSLATALREAAALITFPSTCALEGMLKGLPVAQVDYRSTPFYVASAWEIRSADHIPNVIQELLYPPPAKLAFQDACLADELEIGGASERLAEVIREALSRSNPYEVVPPQVEKNGLGRLDYRQVYSELSVFAAAPTSMIQYELDAAYATIKQLRTEQATRQEELLELAEGLGTNDLDKTGRYSFLDHFAEGKVSAEASGTAEIGYLKLEGKFSRTLFLHPPARLTFRLQVRVAGKLSFAVMLHPEVWDKPGCGPCRFVIEADGVKLWEVTVDPARNSSDRRWRRFDVTVPATRTGGHVIIFRTEGVGSAAYRWANWRAPVFVWDMAEEDQANLVTDAPVAGTNAGLPACINAAEGLCAPAKKPDCYNQEDLSEFSFLDRFAEGELVAEEPGTASVGSFLEDGELVRTLLLHPPAQLAFTVADGSSGHLCFAVGMHPDVWRNAASGPCQFIVNVDGNCVCDATIDPVNDPADRRWLRFDVDIPESLTGEHVFMFKTEGVNANDFRWALWRSPLFLWKAGDEKETNETMPSTLQIPEFYQPGRTVA